MILSPVLTVLRNSSPRQSTVGIGVSVQTEPIIAPAAASESICSEKSIQAGQRSINEQIFDIPFTDDLSLFNQNYLLLTRQVAESCIDYDLSEQSMVIGTSALAQYEIDGAVGMYSGIFNNPFLIWGKYRRSLFKAMLTVSFQFHHTQMDGAHAARFLDEVQKEIKVLKC